MNERCEDAARRASAPDFHAGPSRASMGSQWRGFLFVPGGASSDTKRGRRRRKDTEMSGDLETIKEGKLCPKCGTQVEADAKFCGSCGTSLVTLCPQCGEEVAPDAQFCTACGAAMSQEAGSMRVAARIAEFLENSGVENKHLLAGKYVTPAVLKAVHLDCLEPDEKPLLLVKFKVGRLANATPGFWTKLMLRTSV